MSPLKLTDRDLLFLILLFLITVGISVVDGITQLIHPTQSFVDFFVLFGLGWGAYQLGKMSD